jgi:urease accessory protein
MDHATEVAAAGTWDGAPVDVVELDYDGRHRRRVVMTCASGRALLLDLPAAVQLRDGDALRLADGGHVVVRAAAEPLLELRAPSAHALVRLAWHLGNRHVPAELGDGWLRIRPDHVLADLARRLGAEVLEKAAAFEPEPGAYAGHAHAMVRRP